MFTLIKLTRKTVQPKRELATIIDERVGRGGKEGERGERGGKRGKRGKEGERGGKRRTRVGTNVDIAVP